MNKLIPYTSGNDSLYFAKKYKADALSCVEHHLNTVEMLYFLRFFFLFNYNPTTIKTYIFLSPVSPSQSLAWCNRLNALCSQSSNHSLKPGCAFSIRSMPSYVWNCWINVLILFVYEKCVCDFFFFSKTTYFYTCHLVFSKIVIFIFFWINQRKLCHFFGLINTELKTQKKTC